MDIRAVLSAHRNHLILQFSLSHFRFSLDCNTLLVWGFSQPIRLRHIKKVFYLSVCRNLFCFVISGDPSARTSVEHAYLGKHVRALILLTFIDNVKKRRYLKIRIQNRIDFAKTWSSTCEMSRTFSQLFCFPLLFISWMFYNKKEKS